VLVSACSSDEPEVSAPASSVSAATATAWFNLQLRLVRETPGFTPPVASRAFAYTGIALYEAVVPGMPGYRSLAGALHELPALPQAMASAQYDWGLVANAALAEITRDMFPTAPAEELTAIDALEQQQAGSGDAAVRERSATYGHSVAAAVYAWSQTDGGDQGYLHNFPTSYVPPTGPGMWIPTPPMFQSAMQPTWGTNRTFALASADACPIDPPPAFSIADDSTFYMQANEVFQTSQHLTQEQTDIALFWADDPVATSTPPGHIISIATQQLDLNESTLDVAAEAYAKLGIALADSFISCWATKFKYNVIRPVSYIDENIQRDWLPLIATPPFPEYPSGHSSQSAAAAQVLTAMFGTVTFTDHTNDYRGLAPRTFTSFEAAAEEAAISRLYAGIHYRAAIENALTMGHCVGDTVNALPFR
jgi:membrane-associated phospholipid phosphatase